MTAKETGVLAFIRQLSHTPLRLRVVNFIPSVLGIFNKLCPEAVHVSECLIQKLAPWRVPLLQQLCQSCPHVSEPERPMTVDEVQYLNEFMTVFPENCDVTWGLSEDSTLENAIKAIILVNVKD